MRRRLWHSTFVRDSSVRKFTVCSQVPGKSPFLSCDLLDENHTCVYIQLFPNQTKSNFSWKVEKCHTRYRFRTLPKLAQTLLLVTPYILSHCKQQFLVLLWYFLLFFKMLILLLCVRQYSECRRAVRELAYLKDYIRNWTVNSRFTNIESKRHTENKDMTVKVKNSSPKSLSADCRYTVGQLSAGSIPTVNRQLTNSKPKLKIWQV